MEPSIVHVHRTEAEHILAVQNPLALPEKEGVIYSGCEPVLVRFMIGSHYNLLTSSGGRGRASEGRAFGERVL